MTDYAVCFPVTSLGAGINGYKALHSAITRDTASGVVNALGDPRDANGDIVVPPPYTPGDPPPVDNVAFHGRPGSPATTITGPGGETIEIPARGDPALYYCHVRSEQSPVGDNPPDGLSPSDPIHSAAVLGIWAGDEVPQPP